MIVATSWDDGLVSDLKLMEILDKYSAIATFCINSRSHQSTESRNDSRSVEYGYKVARCDLREFARFDICNHTATHKQIDKVPLHVACLEICNGKADLEQLYQREINGIVWPYGVWTTEAIEFAKGVGHTYGRTTHLHPHQHEWNITPIHWRINPTKFIQKGPEFAVLSGHTYEIQSRSDWRAVDNLYASLTSATSVQLVSLTEFARIWNARR